MKLSVIIPCHPRNLPTLPRTRESIAVAAESGNRDALVPKSGNRDALVPIFEVETIVVEDTESKGLPWARNQGLARATGDYVFFVDADDTVHPDFFRHPLDKLVATGADFCLFENSRSPLRRDYDLSGNASVRAALLPAYIGFSFDDVRRWNAGGDLFARREFGSVCRVAFKRAFLERHHLRFDERLLIYEDAPFMAACALCADRVVSLREDLYNYLPSPIGITATETGRAKYWDYKFAIHEHRLALDDRFGGVWKYCEASPAFTALEFLRRGRGLRPYLALPRVRASLQNFPVSFRHPLTALAVQIAKCL